MVHRPRQAEMAVARFRFGKGQRLPHLGARVVSERFAADTDDHIPHRQHTCQWRGLNDNFVSRKALAAGIASVFHADTGG